MTRPKPLSREDIFAIFSCIAPFVAIALSAALFLASAGGLGRELSALLVASVLTLTGIIGGAVMGYRGRRSRWKPLAWLGLVLNGLFLVGLATAVILVVLALKSPAFLLH